jgi:hypothetical protein
MRTHVASIRIAAPASAVTAFTADGAKLPTWAIGFAKDAVRDGEHWLVTTASGGRLPLRIVVDEADGVVDYVMEPAPGVEVTAATRAVEVPGGSVYTFVMVLPPDVPDTTFDAQVAELERELTVLKAHLETACPL